MTVLTRLFSVSFLFTIFLLGFSCGFPVTFFLRWRWKFPQWQIPWRANVFFQVAPWTGRFYSLLDPSYAKNNIPIIASVSEHQPTTWSSFYFDLQMLVFMFPVGLYYCFAKLTDANIFIIIYGVTSIYFAVSKPFLDVLISLPEIRFLKGFEYVIAQSFVLSGQNFCNENMVEVERNKIDTRLFHFFSTFFPCQCQWIQKWKYGVWIAFSTVI